MLYWLFLLIMVIAAIVAASKIEPFIDSSLADSNCLNYVQNELEWSIDHNIDKHLPKPPVDPKFIATEKAKLIEARKAVLQQFDAMKSKVYSNLSVDYPYAGACILRDDRMLNYLNNTSGCAFKGKVLSYDMDPVNGSYGRRKEMNITVPMKSFAEFVKSEDPEPFKKEYYPTEGCIIPTSDKDGFFDNITNMAKLNLYKNENENNKVQMSSQKIKDDNARLKGTLNVYGVNTDPNDVYDTNLDKSCEIKTTPLQDNGGFKYNNLDKLNVECGDEKGLSGFKLIHTGGKSQYQYTCCSLKTSDNKIKPQITDDKMTIMNTNSSNWLNPWDMNTEMECDQFMNQFKFNLNSNEQPNYDYYQYKCSSLKKSSDRDRRQVKMSCLNKKTPEVYAEMGTQNMKDLNIDCQNDMLKSVKMFKNKDKYGYEYKCCRPYLEMA